MRIQTNYVRRFHLHVDPEARVLDCFRVHVPGPPSLLVNQGTRQNVTLDQLWRETLDTVEFLRKTWREQYRWQLRLRNPLDLEPFAIVTACEEEREMVKHHVDMDILCYESSAQMSESHPETQTPREHEQRVRHLIDAWDGLEWLAVN